MAIEAYCNPTAYRGHREEASVMQNDLSLAMVLIAVVTGLSCSWITMRSLCLARSKTLRWARVARGGTEASNGDAPGPVFSCGRGGASLLAGCREMQRHAASALAGNSTARDRARWAAHPSRAPADASDRART